MAKKRRVNPWPFDLPVDPRNDSLVRLPNHHPAKVLLMTHARCRVACAGREIPWPGREQEAFDQEFTSETDGRRWTFSDIVYCFVCFSLVAHGWLKRPCEMLGDELFLMQDLPKKRTLVRECRAAAMRDQNHRVLDLLPLVDGFFAACEDSVLARLREDGIPRR